MTRRLSIRFTPMLLLVCLLLAGCGADSAAQSADPATNPGSVAANTTGSVPKRLTGRVLVKSHGSPMQTDTTTRKFTARKPWVVTYYEHCGSLSAGPGGKVIQVAGIDPRHPNGDELGIIYAMGHLSSGHSQPQAPGFWKLRILTGGCSWRVVAQEE